MNTFIYNIWKSINIQEEYLDITVAGSKALFIIAICGLVYYACRHVVSPIITRIVRHTETKWDDILLNQSMLKALCILVFTILLNIFLPSTLNEFKLAHTIGTKACSILLIMASVHVINQALLSWYSVLKQNEAFTSHPLKGILQVLQLASIIIGLIIIVSILINRNPLYILSGIGASAAILMLVFKDTILGLVAGLQLSANDMLKTGDWITIPRDNVNGIVKDVSLTTVKIENFDKTIITVPPYSLISDSFQNWKGMVQSGGRRVMRAVNIDMSTVRFVTEQEMKQWENEPWFADFTQKKEAEKPVNLTVFRHYLEYFISNYSLTKAEYLYMVRQLEPTSQGLPLEIYFFTTCQDWKEYEHVQADVIDHVLATIQSFGLRVYQLPTGKI